MDVNDPQTVQTARQGFKQFNKFMLLLWRLGLGKWVNFAPASLGQIMVLTHTGRKSGLRRQTPVNYALVEGEVYCTAGFGPHCDWYRNILAQPQVEIWLPDGWWEGQAEVVNDPAARLPILRQVLIASGFAASLFGGLDPRSIDDEALAAATGDYQVIRIRRTAPRTGPGGPGDLAWVWPLATLLLLPLALRLRK